MELKSLEKTSTEKKRKFNQEIVAPDIGMSTHSLTHNYSDADDSSDEEDPGIELEQGEGVALSWDYFLFNKLHETNKILNKANQVNSNNKDTLSPIRTSFEMLHLGISLLHAESIQAIYKNIKKQYLSNNTLKADKNELIGLIKKSLKSTIEIIFGKDIVTIHDSDNQLLKNLIEDSQVQEIFEAIAKDLASHVKLILKAMHKPYILKEYKSEPIKQLREKLQSALPIIRNIKCDSKQRQEIKYNKRLKHLNEAVLYLAIKELEDDIEQADENIKTNEKGLFALHTYLKKTSKRLRKDEIEDPEVKDLNTFLEKLFDETQQKLNNNLITNAEDCRRLPPSMFVEIYKDIFLKAKFESLNTEEDTFSNSNTFNATALWKLFRNLYTRVEVRKQIAPCVSWTAARLEQFIRDNLAETKFYKILSEQLFLYCGAKLERSYLPRAFIFHPLNQTTFFAQLRTANRSQTRAIRDLKSKQIPGGDLLRIKWQFASGLTYDDQEINKKYGRSDKTSAISSYQEINKEIEKIKQEYKLTDTDIAILIRKILTGKDKEKISAFSSQVSTFLTHITYLLFGSEAVRNPASFITHQMMLDLIISSELTWKDAFNHSSMSYGGGGLMPMSMAGAVKCSRRLCLEFDEYMPYRYYYEGSESRLEGEDIKALNELIYRQHQLVQMWFQHKEQVQNTKISDSNRVHFVAKQMENVWYSNVYASENIAMDREENLSAENTSLMSFAQRMP